MKPAGHFCSALLAIVVSLSCVGCASNAKKEGMRNYFDDGIVPLKVKLAYINGPTLQWACAGIETFDWADAGAHARLDRDTSSQLPGLG
ncbi:MAG: hypothetical protein ABI648_01350 [Betaproteobacteria bacterium]|jgi:hypothetical protein